MKLLGSICLLLIGTGLSAQLGPVFLDPAPPDSMLTCREDLPPGDTLRATVLLSDGVLFGIVDVLPSDSIVPGSDSCQGGVRRIWEVSDALGTTRQTQNFEYRDNVSPFFTLPPDTSLTCGAPAPEPDVAGELSGIGDNCTPTDALTVSYRDSIEIDTSCYACFFVFRTWTVTDNCGNVTSKDQTIRIADTIPPTAVCQPAQVFVDPSGRDSVLITPDLIDNGSTDNCGIFSREVSVTTVTCDQIGQTIPIALTLRDSSDNLVSCGTTLTINGDAPEPTSSGMVCGGDTLRLFANPPTPTEGNISPYTFRWFGPLNSLISTDENPVFPQINGTADGAYRVEIRGISGCVTEGIVNVTIGDVPPAPSIQVPAETICIGDSVRLISLSSYSGEVIFRWFRGTPSSPTPIGSSKTGTFTTSLPGETTTATFFAVVTVDGCTSAPSDQVLVTAVPQPVISVAEASIKACQFENVRLEALGDPSLTYRWTSPNAVVSIGAVIDIPSAQPEQSGIYSVVAFSNEACQSDPVQVELEVAAAPAPSALEGPEGICPGATLSLSATDRSGDGYLFVGPAGQTIASDSPDIEVSDADGAVAGLWRVRIRRGDCLSAFGPSLEVRLLPLPVAVAGASPDPVCEGNVLRLFANSVGSGGRYAWTGPDNFSSSEQNPVLTAISQAASGDYKLTVTNGAGCVDETVVRVNVLPGITIDDILVEGNKCLKPGDVVRLTADISPELDPANYRYTWTDPQGATSSGTSLVISDPGPPANGTYRLVVENPVGCLSPPQTLDLVLNLAPAAPAQPVTDNERYDFCRGDAATLQTSDAGPGSTYKWEGPAGFEATTSENFLQLELDSDATSGSYRVTVLRGDCESDASVARILTVTEPPLVTASVALPVCAGEPILFSAGDLPGVFYAWSGPNGFSAGAPNPRIIVADPETNNGEYVLIASRDGCPGPASSVTVNVLPRPLQPQIGEATPVCIDDEAGELILNITPATQTPGASYQWYSVQGDRLIETTDEPVLTVGEFTQFDDFPELDIIAFTVVDSCRSDPSTPTAITLSRTFNQQADAGTDTTVCVGEHRLSAIRPVNGGGRWTQVQGPADAGIAEPSDPSTRVTNLRATSVPYRFAWTLSNGACFAYSSDTVTVMVTDQEMADAGPNRVACIGGPVTLAAVPPTTAGSTGRWTQRATQALIGVGIVDPTDPNTAVTGLRADNVYTFTWTVTGRCGTSSEAIAVSVSDPTPRAGADQRVCMEDPVVDIQATAPSLGSTGRWFAVGDGPVFANPSGPASSVTGFNPGINLLVWELDDGVCGSRSRDTLAINFILPPLPEDDVVDIPFQGSTDFDPTANDENPLDARIEFGPLTPNQGSLEDNGNGTYTFVAPTNFVGTIRARYEVITEGCRDITAEVRFTIGEDASCEIPNIFTPNRDGINDFFVIPCLLDTDDFPQSEVTVYNQWGDEVFRSGKPYSNDWSGTYQGGDLPVGTYFYLVNLGDGSETMNGHLRIER